MKNGTEKNGLISLLNIFLEFRAGARAGARAGFLLLLEFSHFVFRLHLHLIDNVKQAPIWTIQLVKRNIFWHNQHLVS